MEKIPYIWAESKIGTDGRWYVAVVVKEPDIISETDLFNGGYVIHFDFDWKKQTTEAWSYTFKHGAPSIAEERIHLWKNDILSDKEILEFCKNWYQSHSAP